MSCLEAQWFILPVSLNGNNERYTDLFSKRIQPAQQPFTWKCHCFKAELPDIVCTGTVIAKIDTALHHVRISGGGSSCVQGCTCAVHVILALVFLQVLCWPLYTRWRRKRYWVIVCLLWDCFETAHPHAPHRQDVCFRTETTHGFFNASHSETSKQRPVKASLHT